MKLLLTTPGRLFKNERGEYYTPVVYGYNYFKRYFDVFDEIKLAAHCEDAKDIPEEYLRVDGPGVSVIEIPFPHGKLQHILKYFSINRSLKDKIKSDTYDVAVLRVPDQLSFQLFNVIKKYDNPIGAEVVAHSWQLFTREYYNSIFCPAVRFLWDYNEKKICRQADATCYVTEYFLQERYKPDTSEGHFTVGCSDADITDTASAPKEYGNGKKSFTLLHVSTGIEKLTKGHKELLESAAMLKKDGTDVKVVCVGHGELMPEVQAIIDNNSLSDCVKLTGRLNKQQLDEAYENADVFVFPSYREGLPRVVVEAMSHALPVIGSDIPGLRELVDAECLVPVRDSKALYFKLKAALTDTSFLERQSKKNLEKSKEFSKEKLQAKRNTFYSWLGEQSNARKQKD